jgi:hypothetical protein
MQRNACMQAGRQADSAGWVDAVSQHSHFRRVASVQHDVLNAEVHVHVVAQLCPWPRSLEESSLEELFRFGRPRWRGVGGVGGGWCALVGSFAHGSALMKESCCCGGGGGDASEC